MFSSLFCQNLPLWPDGQAQTLKDCKNDTTSVEKINNPRIMPFDYKKKKILTADFQTWHFFIQEKWLIKNVFFYLFSFFFFF